MTDNEALIEETDAIMTDLVARHGFPVIGAILGSAAALAVVNGRAPYLRDVLGLLNATVEQMEQHWKESLQ